MLNNKFIFDRNYAAEVIAEQKTSTEPFKFAQSSELTKNPKPLRWLIKGIISRQSINLLFGEPTAGKTLFALDWAFCVSSGRDWHGLQVKQSDVFYIAGEGFSGFSQRLKALEVKYKAEAPCRLYVSEMPANLSDSEFAQWVAESISAVSANPGLIVVDTLHRNMEGDENSSQDIGKFISNLDNFFKPLGAAVLVVHHSGHGQKDRSRGSSSIRAAMDGEYGATKDGSSIVLTCHKSKDSSPITPMSFGITSADLGWCDEDGEPLTSVYLEQCDFIQKSGGKKRRLSARDDAILTSLNEAIAAHGVEPSTEIKAKFGGFDSHVGRLQKVVNIERWRELAYKAMAVDAKPGEDKIDTKKKAFQRCRNKLFDGGFTIEHGDYVWRLFE